MARVTSEYVPNNADMARFLMGPEVARVARAAADDIRDAAEAAERMRPKKGESTGKLADGYKVDMGVASPTKSEGGPRHAGIVYNDVDYAAVIELGGEDPHIEGQHVLERAAAPWHVPYGIRRALGSGK